MNYYYILKNVHTKLCHGTSSKNILLDNLELFIKNNEYDFPSRMEIKFTTKEQLEDVILFYTIIFPTDFINYHEDNKFYLTYAKKLDFINESNLIVSKNNAFEAGHINNFLYHYDNDVFRLHSIKNAGEHIIVTSAKNFK